MKKVKKMAMGGLGGPLGPSPAINQNELQKAQMQATQRSGFSSTPAMGSVGKPLKPQVMPTAQPQSVPQSVSGMTQRQLNDLIKQKNADMSGRRGMDPKGYDVKPQVMPSVKPSVKPRINQNELQKAYDDVYRQTSGTNKPQVMPNPRSIPRTKPSVPHYLQPGYAGLQGTPAPNSGPRAPGAPNPIPQSILGIMKKGGEVKKYAKNGKINLDACGVSTAQKSKSSPKW